VIAADVDAACALWREVPPLARALIAAFWPGPLTLVLPANRERVSARVTGGTDGVGVRVPGRAAARGLAAMAGGVLVATSANRTGEPPALSAADVRTYFGDEVPVADGGVLAPSRGSTVVSLMEWPPVVLRDGDCDRLALARVLELGLMAQP
jgi:L-threonylcarbamoyladenylate synthase